MRIPPKIHEKMNNIPKHQTLFHRSPINNKQWESAHKTNKIFTVIGIILNMDII